LLLALVKVEIHKRIRIQRDRRYQLLQLFGSLLRVWRLPEFGWRSTPWHDPPDLPLPGVEGDVQPSLRLHFLYTALANPTLLADHAFVLLPLRGFRARSFTGAFVYWRVVVNEARQFGDGS